MTLPDKLSKEIDELWCKNLSLVYSRIETIRSAIESLKRDQLTEDFRTKATREAHSLAGSLGTFGLQTASDAAAEIERAFQSSIKRDDALGVGKYLAQIKQAVDGRRTDS